MPIYRVTWNRSCEWVVEGPSIKEVLAAARDMDDFNLDYYTEVSVNIHESKHPSKPEAVYFEGDLLAPEDAEQYICNNLLNQVVNLEEAICPECGQPFSPSAMRNDSCPNCNIYWTRQRLEEMVGEYIPEVLDGQIPLDL